MSNTRSQQDGLIGHVDLKWFAKERVREKLKLSKDHAVPEDMITEEHDRLVRAEEDFNALQAKNHRRYAIEFFLPYACRLVDSKKAIHQHYSPKSFTELALEIIKLSQSGDAQSIVACDLLSNDKAFITLCNQVESGEIQLPVRISHRKLNAVQRHNQYLLGLIDTTALLTSNLLIDNSNLKNDNLSDLYESSRGSRDIKSKLSMYCEHILRDLKFARNQISESFEDDERLFDLVDAAIQSVTGFESKDNYQVGAAEFNSLAEAVSALTGKKYPLFNTKNILSGNKQINAIPYIASLVVAGDHANTANDRIVARSGRINKELNAISWFKQASDHEIMELKESGFNGELVENILDYLSLNGCEKSKQFIEFARAIEISAPGLTHIEYQINEDAVKDWIAVNRPSCVSSENSMSM